MVDGQIVEIKHLAKHTPLQIHPDPKKSIKKSTESLSRMGGGLHCTRKLRGVIIDALPSPLPLETIEMTQNETIATHTDPSKSDYLDGPTIDILRY